MKKAFSTVACMQASLKEILEATQKYGLDGVEIRLNADNSVMGFEGKKAMQEARLQFEQSGVVVTDLGSSICITAYDENIVPKAQEIVECAAILGAKGVRVFLGHFSSRVNPDLPSCDYLGIVKQLKELCALAAEKNVEIWIETHNEFATGKVLKQLIEDVAWNNLQVIWDIMHPLEDGESLEETWKYVGDRIAHIHIKDGFDRLDESWHDYQYSLLGEGAVPIVGMLDLLQSVGYDGYISLEWESQWRQELKGYDNSLDWVLTQYVDYLKRYEENPIPVIGEKWKKTDAPGRSDFPGFAESPLCGEAVIDNRRPYASCKRYLIETQIIPGREYRVSLPYREYETASVNSVYGLITLLKEDDTPTRRIYLEKTVCGRMEYTVKTDNETKIRIELGIKRYGKVVWHRPLLQEIKSLPSSQPVPDTEGQEKSDRKLRIASVCQKVMSVTYEENLKRISDAFDKAASEGADLLAFAETMNTRGVTDLSYEDSFETMDGRFCTLMKEKAREYGCYVFFSFRELDEYGARRNTAVLLGREGQLIGRYHKSHLALVEYENGMVPGDEYPVFDTEFGKVGMLICWDAYFTEPARAMSRKGAELLFISTAGNPTYRHIARAKENGVYVVVSCAAAVEERGIAATKIIDPCGNILAQADEDGVAAVADVNLDEEKHIFWLSVGASDAIPDNIYRHEYRDDLI